MRNSNIPLSHSSGLRIVFKHLKPPSAGRGPLTDAKRQPVLLLHGWPGSIVEFNVFSELLLNDVSITLYIYTHMHVHTHRSVCASVSSYAINGTLLTCTFRPAYAHARAHPFVAAIYIQHCRFLILCGFVLLLLRSSFLNFLHSYTLHYTVYTHTRTHAHMPYQKGPRGCRPVLARLRLV